MPHPVHLLLLLPPGRADMAYPLARAADPGLTLSRWRAVVRRRAPSAATGAGATGAGATGAGATGAGGRASGVVAAETRRGYLRGLFAYRVAGRAGTRRVLTVQWFSAPGLIGSAVVARLLLAEADRLAACHGCAGIDLVLAAAAGDTGPTEIAPGLIAALPGPFHDLDLRVRCLTLDLGQPGTTARQAVSPPPRCVAG